MTPQLPPTQDGIAPDSTDRVVVIRWSRSSRSTFHALVDADDGPEPACSVKSREGSYDAWGLAQAIAWRDPCRHCFEPDTMVSMEDST